MTIPDLRSFLHKVADLGCSTLDADGNCLACQAAELARAMDSKSLQPDEASRTVHIADVVTHTHGHKQNAREAQ